MAGTIPDEHLVEHIRAGDDEAAELLFARHHEALLAFCRHMLGGRAAGASAVRSAFTQALGILRRHDRPVNFKVLLFSVARQCCVAALDSRPGAVAATVDLAGLDPEVGRDAELRALLTGLDALPLDQRAVLVLSELAPTRARSSPLSWAAPATRWARSSPRLAWRWSTSRAAT